MSNILRDGNTLRFNNLSDPSVPHNFLSVINVGRKRGYTDFLLDFERVAGVYPNTAVPLAGLCQFLTEHERIEFDFSNVSTYLHRIGVTDPPVPSDDEHTYLNTVWCFQNHTHVGTITNGFVDALAEHAVCEQGVLNALGFCVNEVMDNVLLHSDAAAGYAMAQIHTDAKHIALSIYDTGRGIFNSLSDSHSPNSASHAIELAIQLDITDGKGAGFGLWGLNQLVDANSGRLSIGSGSGLFVVNGDEKTLRDDTPFLSYANNCTTVDFQIDFDKRIDVAGALGGYEPLDFYVEHVEDFEGNVTFNVAQESPGTGTRADGVIARNRALNYDQLADGMVILDFVDVDKISSSFADEFVSKLLETFGVETFRKRFTLINQSEFVSDIIGRSTAKRVANSGK